MRKKAKDLRGVYVVGWGWQVADCHLMAPSFTSKPAILANHTSKPAFASKPARHLIFSVKSISTDTFLHQQTKEMLEAYQSLCIFMIICLLQTSPDSLVCKCIAWELVLLEDTPTMLPSVTSCSWSAPSISISKCSQVLQSVPKYFKVFCSIATSAIDKPGTKV